MILAMLIVLPILTYFFAIGLCWKPFQMRAIKNCERCYIDSDGDWMHKQGYRDEMHSSHYHDAAPWAALVWPVSLPVLAGQLITMRDGSKVSKELEKVEAANIRRKEELTEAEHQVRLAKLCKQENDLLDVRLAELERRPVDR